jgi:hypothetical protein
MKIAMYDLEGHFLKLYEVESYSDLIEQLGKKSGINSPSSIQKVCLGERNFAKNRQFRIVSKDRVLDKIGSCLNLKKTKETQVHKYFDGSYVCTYNSFTEAALKNNANKENIAQACSEKNTRVLSAAGFTWKKAI